MKPNTLILIIILFATGCGKSENINLWWKGGQSQRFYPLQIRGDMFEVYGHKAFINTKSMIVTCDGSPILLGENRTLYLTAESRVLAYNFETESIESQYSLSEIAEMHGRPVQQDREVSADTTWRKDVKGVMDCTDRPAHQFHYRQ